MLLLCTDFLYIPTSLVNFTYVYTYTDMCIYLYTYIRVQTFYTYRHLLLTLHTYTHHSIARSAAHIYSGTNKAYICSHTHTLPSAVTHPRSTHPRSHLWICGHTHACSHTHTYIHSHTRTYIQSHTQPIQLAVVQPLALGVSVLQPRTSIVDLVLWVSFTTFC